MFRRNFLFGVDSNTANVIGVTAEDIYQPGKGYGFIIEENRREQELLKISELNSGFDTVFWYQDENLTCIENDDNGCYLDSDAEIQRLETETGEKMEGEPRRIPLSFKMDVPRQGNYKVNITIQAEEEMPEVLIFTGRRRLAYRGSISAGTEFKFTMMVNVCDIVPRGKERIYTDKTLDITVVAAKPRITALTVTEVTIPTVYIAGDSTVTDQSADYPYAPGTSYSGWGQMLTAYLGEGVAVSNHAHSGLTTDSFRKEGHSGIIDISCRPRDFYLFQFGHNDQKLDELKARGGYQANLVRYINECHEKGTYPLLVTPLARNSWKGNNGGYNDLLEEYAEVCLEIGRLTDTPVLDLHKLSMDFVLEKGLEEAKKYFFPGDFTHSNDYGAYRMAGFIAQEIKRVCSNHENPGYRYLAKCVTEGFGEWKAADNIVMPVQPAILRDKVNPNAGAELLSEIDRLEEQADRASVLDMIIKTARFFPTNVYNDMFTDVVGHEWYAGTVECAYQNGIIHPAMVENDQFRPLQKITLEEFLVLAMGGYQSRKPFPEEEPCAYDGQCEAYAMASVRAACSIGLIPQDGSAGLKNTITRGQAVTLCRAMKI